MKEEEEGTRNRRRQGRGCSVEDMRPRRSRWKGWTSWRGRERWMKREEGIIKVVEDF